MKHSVLASQISESPLSGQAVLRPKSSRKKIMAHGTLLLTSLVDAFSILVIYLLMSTTSASETMDLEKEIQLPMASTSNTLEAGTVIKIQDGKYIIGEQEIDLAELVDYLQDLYANKAEHEGEILNLIIQADKSITYKDINPILLAGSQTGFHELRFAVLHKEEI